MGALGTDWYTELFTVRASFHLAVLLLSFSYQAATMYIVDSGVFDSLWYSLTINLLQTPVSLLLYGVYVNLFLLSLCSLSRRKAAGNKLLLVASCIMAVAGSTQLALDVAVTASAARLVQQVVHSGIPPAERDPMRLAVLEEAQILMFGINNFITDSIFLYRCYVIWGSQRKSIILPALLMISTLMSVIFKVAINRRILSYILGAATNLVLTASTAGRIMWIQRAASHVALDRSIRGRYTRATVIILESGAIYCAMAIFLAISGSLNDEILNFGFGIGQQLLNIIPTCTLVYIGRNHNANGPRTDPESHPNVPLSSPAGRQKVPRPMRLRRAVVGNG
ncbi:hypothetical protein K438DRAFT_80113 [Mycena galopus ATCC 62051]|nr:hypothetical protein K438DRAFT_80113 [Mycena galopus ATCC 62051]